MLRYLRLLVLDKVVTIVPGTAMQIQLSWKMRVVI
jgi:hypothetical protein